MTAHRYVIRRFDGSWWRYGTEEDSWTSDLTLARIYKEIPIPTEDEEVRMVEITIRLLPKEKK